MMELQQCNVGRLQLPLVIGRPAVILCMSLPLLSGVCPCPKGLHISVCSGGEYPGD